MSKLHYGNCRTRLPHDTSAISLRAGSQHQHEGSTMLYQVTHSTRYSYESAVSHSLNEVRLTPRPCPAQHVRTTAIHVQPEPVFMHQREDYYGNSVASF